MDEIFNVVKLQNGIDIGKDEVFDYILIMIMKLCMELIHMESELYL